MAFVLELQTQSKQKYIQNYIVNVFRKFQVKVDVLHKDEQLSFICDDSNENLEKALNEVAQTLPASLFLKGSSNSEVKITPEDLPLLDNRFPLSLGLCPLCQKEMLDVSSKRYYYPFTSCNCCGANHSFLTKYPYIRENTSFKFLVPCQSCVDEQNSFGNKEQHHINSCHSCGVPVRLVSKTSQRYANDAGSFRTMFEVSAKAINDGKKILIKTTMGYRVFYKADKLNNNSILMMINSNTITDNLSLITEEFRALLSIERPILHVALKNESLKDICGANTAYVKYPDDGFSILLGVELQKLGVDFVAYEVCDETMEADLVMDYDLEITPQTDMRFFINKDTQFIASGQRVSFPSHNFSKKGVALQKGEYVALSQGSKVLFDKKIYFEGEFSKVDVLDDELSFSSVIAENNLFGKKCVGAYFDEVPSFLYYDGKNVLRVVPPKPFESENFLEKIEQLRDGSNRLILNLKEKMPKTFESLKSLENKDDVKLFEAVAIVLDLEDKSMNGIVKEAMKFVGKGGIQIDTHVTDNRFDNTAFLASIISYMLAGVSKPIIAYSIFESMGDYFYDIVQELLSKTKASDVVICGVDFANQSLFSRIQRNFKMNPPHININYPMGSESCIVGAV